MKITVSQLRRIIKEEISRSTTRSRRVLREMAEADQLPMSGEDIRSAVESRTPVIYQHRGYNNGQPMEGTLMLGFDTNSKHHRLYPDAPPDTVFFVPVDRSIGKFAIDRFNMQGELESTKWTTKSEGKLSFA